MACRDFFGGWLKAYSIWKICKSVRTSWPILSRLRRIPTTSTKRTLSRSATRMARISLRACCCCARRLSQERFCFARCCHWSRAGNYDPIIPTSETQRLVELLRHAGADVTVRFLNAGHALTPEDISLARDWLRGL